MTPLFLLAALAVGLVALLTLPREEEPQISVPMVDLMVRANGLKAEDAVKLVTEPLETIVKSIDGVEHVYSQTRDDEVMVTARFLVGTSSDAAILRVHEKIRANIARIPQGIHEPLIIGRGIDDVAITVLTLSPRPEAAEHWTASGVSRVARELQVELAKLDDIGLTYVSGISPRKSVSSRILSACRTMASRCSSSPARSPPQIAPFRRASSATKASRSR